MSKKYDYRRIQAYRAYTVRDICRLYQDLKLHEHTIREWINLGELEAFQSGKKLYVYGGVLKKYLKDKRNRKRRSLTFEEHKCWTCGTVAVPTNNIIKHLKCGQNNNVTSLADCPGCGLTMRRSYPTNAVPEILRIFTVEQNDVSRLYDSTCSTRKTDIENEEKIPVCESGKQKTISTFKKTSKNEKESITSIKKTSIKPEQLNLFSLPEEL